MVANERVDRRDRLGVTGLAMALGFASSWSLGLGCGEDDAGSGGSLEGMIVGVDKILERIDAQTKIIPGHGPLGNKAQLKEYRDMLATVHKRMKKLIQEGKPIDEIIAAKPTADLDAKWGRGFLKPDVWVRIVYSVMKK